MRAQHLESFLFFSLPRKTYFVGYLPPGELTVGLFVCLADPSDPEKLGARKKRKVVLHIKQTNENS